MCECQHTVLRKLAKRLRALAKEEKRNDAEFQALGLKQAADLADEWAELAKKEST